ncbi:serpin-type proteinase inhibitor 14 [Vairimorpha necatrix]|uniref:Serpin-type proteinase inhibitor 14 n=1 Tax=Vairimorpha necatrix TaxID=6039 RepID=A0AAX4JHJ9_9MICR
MKMFIEEFVKFSFKLFNYMVSEDRDFFWNSVVSPYSFSQAVSILLNGVNKDIQTEIIEKLGFKYNIEEFNEKSNKYFKILISNCTENLKVENFLLYQNDAEIKKKFVKVTKEFYNVKFIAFDPKNIKQEINKLVADVTNGYKNETYNIFPRGTNLLVLNIMHLDIEWVHKFNKSGIEDFTTFKGPVKQEMMYQTSEFDTYEDSEIISIEMPYLNSDLSFVAVMPKDLVYWETALKNIFSSQKLDDLLGKMTCKNVNLCFPKFKDFHAYDYQDYIKSLGLICLVNNLKLDNIITGSSSISWYILHEMIIDMNMNGNIANKIPNVNASNLLNKSGINLSFNQPFLWFIVKKDVENKCNIPIFMGQYLTPS